MNSSIMDEHLSNLLAEGEAGQHLAGLPASSIDFLFLDAERSEYVGFWPDVQRMLVPNGLMVVVNAISHQA